MTPKSKLVSFQKSSLISQFNVLFILISIIPLSILWYIYLQIRDTGKIDLTAENLTFTLTYLAIGVGFGYFLMRFIVQRILALTKANEQALRDILGPDKIRELKEDPNEVTTLTRTFEEVISNLENNIKKLELAKGTLHNVFVRVGQGISSFQNINNFLDLIVETITDAVGGKSGMLLLLNEEKTHLTVKTIYGKSSGLMKDVAIAFSGNIFGQVFSSQHNLIISKAGREAVGPLEGKDVVEFPLIAVPLVLQEKALGVLVIGGHKVDIDFTDEELSLVRSVAMQIAVAVENDRLSLDAERSYFDIISALALAVEARDRYSRGHQDRVAEYSVKIAEKLKLSERERDTLRDAAKLHDLGKIGISDEILSKPGSLTDEEWGVMRTHPSVGEEIVKPIKSLAHLRDLVRHHHEKIDGSGYPDGLKGDQVSFLVRILSVADIYDALRTSRPYRKALSKEEAVELLEEMGEKIDQRVVKVLISAV
ncbi:MAG: HD-GYP domain-containing protein [Candidatus Omnitrophica bacterium]|nr:HD-GYP domain-containing protein [Candidatus Omnitrophota bacterium]